MLACLLVIGGAWGFLALAGGGKGGGTPRFDDWGTRAVRRAAHPAIPIGPRWLQESGRDVTALGGVTVLSLVTIAVAFYLLMVRKFAAMWLAIIATVSGLIL